MDAKKKSDTGTQTKLYSQVLSLSITCQTKDLFHLDSHKANDKFLKIATFSWFDI